MKYNYFSESSNKVLDLIRLMHPQSTLGKLSLSDTKQRGTYGLRAYYQQKLAEDSTSTWYVSSFDETTNKKDYKELQLGIRYFSESAKQVVHRHLETRFSTYTKAKDLIKSIKDVLVKNDNIIA